MSTGIEMDFKEKIKSLADKYNLQLIYSFGSRAKEVYNLVEGKISQSSVSKSDLDIGVKSKKSLNFSLYFLNLKNLTAKNRKRIVNPTRTAIFTRTDSNP